MKDTNFKQACIKESGVKVKINEENFIHELKCNNEKAFDYIVDNYSWIIKTVVRRHLYSMPSNQDECINDILMAVWFNINSFDESKGNFKNWIAGVSKYKSIEFKRKYLKHLEYENIDDLNISIEDSVHEELIKKELDEDVESLLSCLKEEDKQLFLKLYVEEKEVQDICDETGVKRDIIYNRVSRGKKKMKNFFKLIESRR